MNDSLQLKKELDSLMSTYIATVVGTGYIDVIVLREHMEQFIKGLSELKIPIHSLSWWCYCKDGNESGCPHGMGGPNYKNGYFSEIAEFDELDIRDVERTLEFIKSKKTKGSLTFQNNTCLTPGFWLTIPETWQNNQH